MEKRRHEKHGMLEENEEGVEERELPVIEPPGNVATIASTRDRSFCNLHLIVLTN